MRRILFAVVCLLLCGTARAQNYVPIVNGVATVDASQGTNAQTSSFLIILTANITSLEIIKPKAGQQITIILQQDSTGGRTVSCAADVLNCVTVTSTASAVTSQAFAYNFNTNKWSGLSGTTGGSVGAVSSVFTRTGAVTATSGDYTCAQVTNCTANGLTSFNGRTTAAAVPTAGDYTALQVTGAVGPVLNVLNYGAVGDGSTDNATAFAAAAAAANAFSGAPMPTVYIPYGATGNFNYSSGLSFTSAVVVRCEPGVFLNYTGSAHAVDMGPGTLTVPPSGSIVAARDIYKMLNCGFTGGATMTQGIYFAPGVQYSTLIGNTFFNFGASGVWDVYGAGYNYDFEASHNHFFLGTSQNGLYTAPGGGTNINSQPRITNNEFVCYNGTTGCGTGMEIAGIGSWVDSNTIAFLTPDIIVGHLCSSCRITNNIFQPDESSGNVITFGDIAGAETIDGLTINHNMDAQVSNTGFFLAPLNGNALLTNSVIRDLRLYDYSNSTEVVKMNNTTGQSGNVYQDILSATGVGALSPKTIIATTISNNPDPWKGLTSEGSGSSGPTYGMACGIGNAAGSTSCFDRVQNHNSFAGSYSRIVLDTGGDSQTYPSRGGYIQHSSTDTELGDFEGHPVNIWVGTGAANNNTSFPGSGRPS